MVVRIKERTKEKHLWARLLGSTVVGQFADTVVFCSIAAERDRHHHASATSSRTLALGWLYKTAVEILVLPVTYRVIAFIKRREPTYQRRRLRLR